jgi:hypothetical protein
VVPDLYEIEGFTETGHPFSLLARAIPSASGSQAWRFIQIWTRNGDAFSRLGPGQFSPEAQGSTYDLLVGGQAVVLGDTVAVTPASWEGWLTFWSSDEEWEMVAADTVWEALGLESQVASFSDGRPVAIVSDGMSGFWVLGVIRVLSEREEANLVRLAPEIRGEHLDTFKRESASVSNEVFDGALIHVSPSGKIVSATTFDDRPRGFAGPGQLFTFLETASGLIQVIIWEFHEDCS